METNREVWLQESIEERYNRKHIDTKIRKEIETNPRMLEKVEQGIALLQEYMAGQYYPSKMVRIEQLQSMDLRALVIDIFIGVAYSQRPELFTSVSAQMASRLKFSDKTDAIKTVAELLAVLCQTDAFDIFKETKQASLYLVSCIELSDQVLQFIENTQYLPPMVCEPLELTHNYSSGYLTHNDSLVLGTGNHHDGDLCLDVLNLMNRVPLQLDRDFLCLMEEEPTFDLDTQEKEDQWRTFKKQSYTFYSMIAQETRFYLTHKVDKRGRIYAQGYHINTQGASFKKAMVELAEEEIVEGVF